ncbi:MAG: hypothetical protein J5699_04170 [Bacteroidales bacterium]|nr:hypothetical protein [Bacteroidales bacterium]
MELMLHLELGPIYQVTYDNGTVIRYKVIGGKNPVVEQIIDNGDSRILPLSDMLMNFKIIEKITK